MFTNRTRLLSEDGLGHTGRRLRDDALSILSAGVEAVDPFRAVSQTLRLEGKELSVAGRRFDLGRYRRVLALGAGKAAVPMAEAVADILGTRVEGAVNALEDRTIGSIACRAATHPLPGSEGRAGARHILELAESAGADDLVLCLISGGASSLMPLPAEGLKLKDKLITTRLLLDKGASIVELNCVRKHLSAIKGGQLARAARPAEVVGLILSDVIGDPLDGIASGPTAPDRTTYADARQVLADYDLADKVPDAVRQSLDDAAFESPGPDDPCFEGVTNHLIGNNRKAQLAMLAEAGRLGYVVFFLSRPVAGEARAAARPLVEEARRIAGGLRPVAVIAGGETTVVVKGRGHGGRNQELALAGLEALKPNELLATLGTDGIDGHSHAAGALADSAVTRRALDSSIQPETFLDWNDSTAFFEIANGLLVTGETGTNVADLALFLAR